MALVPRKSEIAAVATVLDDEGYSDVSQMAGAIVKTVVAQLAERPKNWLVTIDGAPIGPFYSETDAQRWIKRTEAEYGLRGTVIPLWSEHVYALADDQNTNTACECSHPKEAHVVTGQKNRPSKPKECGVYDRHRQRCSCAGFQPRKKG